MSKSNSVKLKVIGRVQGVFYRAGVQEKAKELGIVGYARNEKDKSVTVVAVGPTENLEQFIDWCKEGPTGAKIDEVEIAYAPELPEESFSSFEIY